MIGKSGIEGLIFLIAHEPYIAVFIKDKNTAITFNSDKLISKFYGEKLVTLATSHF